MDESTAAKLKSYTASLLSEISDRAKGVKPEKKSTGINPFTKQKALIRKRSISSPTIVRDDFSKVATDNAADHLTFKNGKWVEEDVDPKTIRKDRRTSEAKPVN